MGVRRGDKFGRGGLVWRFGERGYYREIIWRHIMYDVERSCEEMWLRDVLQEWCGRMK